MNNELAIVQEWLRSLGLDSSFLAYPIHDSIFLKKRDFSFQIRVDSSIEDESLMHLESILSEYLQDSVLHKTVTYSVLVKEPYPINLLSETDPWKLRVGVFIFQEAYHVDPM